jgi:hypothetical protein
MESTGYEHVPTAELPKIKAHLQTVEPQDVQHGLELAEDIALLDTEISRRITEG